MDIKVNFDGLIKDIEEAAKYALMATGQSVLEDIKKRDIIPRMRGPLEDGTVEGLDVSEIDNLVVAITSNTPYARRLYHHPEYNFHRAPWSIVHRDGSVETFDGNPNAQAQWFVPWETGERRLWVEETFAKHLKARLG